MFLTARYYSFPQPFAHTSTHHAYTHTHICNRHRDGSQALSSFPHFGGLAAVFSCVQRSEAVRSWRLPISAGVVTGGGVLWRKAARSWGVGWPYGTSGIWMTASTGMSAQAALRSVSHFITTTTNSINLSADTHVLSLLFWIKREVIYFFFFSFLVNRAKLLIGVT